MSHSATTGTQERPRHFKSNHPVQTLQFCHDLFVYLQEKKLQVYVLHLLKAAKRGYATCPTPTLPANIVDNQVIEYLKQIPTIKNALSGDWKDLSVNQKQEILKNVVKEVNYDNSTKTLTIITIEGNRL